MQTMMSAMIMKPTSVKIFVSILTAVFTADVQHLATHYRRMEPHAKVRYV